MTRSEHIRALLEEYAAQRARNDAELNARVEAAERRDPEIARLRADSVSLALGTMRTILSLPTQEARVEAAQRMRARGQANNAELRRRLKARGLPGVDLERLRARRHEDGSMAGTDEQNFERFDLNRFPEEGGQRAQMALARRLCEEYADHFPETRYRNLLLTGAGGLGKTYLLNCIYARVCDRGLSAVRVTAFKLFESMRRQHMGDSESEFASLTEAPLLLIDDLGTEPMMRNITVEYLFLLLNERTAAKRHTVIATNLTATQLQERYGERVSSRLLDRSVCGVVQLRGKDLRTL